ncbi:hypothetical protein TNCV_2670591 [Trichonephila clavipes]|nr:hypothetical protein TNCV_2670551 [Trichonephila clavipes]GFU36877.1 hypothetical protein TNCV_2670571 [Trichonephila clavipes]GFU36879.1 hypothetical protein TNCV_2670591 [Trichonephila clavipes]
MDLLELNDVLMADKGFLIEEELDKIGYVEEIAICYHKAFIGIGGEPKSVKRLRFGDLLVETNSAVQTKSFLLTKSFLDCSVPRNPHKSLNSYRGVISEPDLLCSSEAEILEGFSDQVRSEESLLQKKQQLFLPNT